MNLLTSLVCGTLLLLSFLLLPGAADEKAPAKKEAPIRFMLHGNMSHEPPTEEYLRFVEQVKPDILIMGVFDQRLYATAVPPPDSKKAPPRSVDELLAAWKQAADRLHKNGIRLVGQMELFVVSDRPADREQGAGWFGYHDRLWDEKRLGPRPAKTAAELLEQPDLDGQPGTDAIARCGCRVNSKALHGCVNKPAWRATQKAMIKAAIDIGVDGFITNRNFINHCACEHCARKLRRHLGERYPAADLRDRLGIRDLAAQPLCLVGSHKDHATGPPALVLEKQRFAKLMVKEFFDEVYAQYGRSLKPDLIVAQWNHMAYFDELHLDRGHLPPSTRTNFAHAAADERWGLPLDVWGKGESLFWYCNWGTTQNTILEKEYAGDTVLYGKLLRTLADGRPYVINKYDFYRPRNMMAEAAALGYVTNAIATPWQHEEDREVVLRYFDFLKKHDAFYRPAESHAEVGLVFPRRAVNAGDASPLEYVEGAGRTLVRDHVLFDMLLDDRLAQTDLARYRAVVLAAPEYLEEAERRALARYIERGGKLLLTPVSREDRERPGAAAEEARAIAFRSTASKELRATVLPNVRTDRERFRKALHEAVGGAERLSRFEFPWSVEAHAYRQPAAGRMVLHLVNYNHQEKAAGKSVAAREAPIAAEPGRVLLRLPDGFAAKSVRFFSPDDRETHTLEFNRRSDLLEFRTPRFLVYGLCVIE